MTQTMDDLDELLQPTVTETRRPAQRPWHLQSQFWVAFFGGFPAITLIAYLNAGRLGASRRKQNLILLSGLVAAIVFVAMVALLEVAEHKRTIRIAGRLLSVVLYLVVAAIQRNDDRHYQTLGAGQYASLWGPGLAAILGGAVLMMLIGAGIVLLGS